VTIAKFMLLDEESDIPVSLVVGGALPYGSAFMAAGHYVVNGITYDCTRQGLYRWWNPTGQFINRIVIGYNSALDVYALISAISWNHTHGTGTEQGDYQTISNVGRYRKWVMRCGYAAGLVNWLLPQVGGPGVRIVNVSTTGAKNGFDDGHVVVETRHGAEWRMWDLTNGCYFRNSAGKHMSSSDLISWFSANPTGMPEEVRLDADMRVSSDVGGSLDIGLYWKYMLETPVQVEAWYRRIFQSIV
jgi:hypothetical protein